MGHGGIRGLLLRWGDTGKLRVSEEEFRTNPKAFWDYNNISAYDGIVRPIWTRNDDGVLSIWTAILDGYVE